jgi:hypothetical protein
MSNSPRPPKKYRARRWVRETFEFLAGAAYLTVAVLVAFAIAMG